jgi:hypothetical protein
VPRSFFSSGSGTAVGVALAVAACGALWLAREGSPASGGDDPATAPTTRSAERPDVNVGSRSAFSEVAVAAAPRLERVTATLGRGGTLARVLDGWGVSPRQRERIAAELASEFDLSRLPAATGLCGSIDEQGRLRRLSIRTEPDRFVRWTEAADGSRVEVVRLPLRTIVRSGEGHVAHCVRQAFDHLPWADELTLAFADIFQWEIDLLIEPRSGDRVGVVFEVETLGEVPSDLPSFAKAPVASGEPLGLGRILAASYDGRIARSEAYWVADPAGGGDYYDADGTPLRKTFLRSPLNYRRISSGFSHGRRHPITREVVPHHGVDFAAPSGTPVVAAADGRVVRVGWQGALGRAIRVRHGSEYVTVYGHLRSYARGIRAGVEVRQNQVIGHVGSTGRATGPHLHYTLIHRGRAIDPMKFRSPAVRALPPELRPLHERAMLAWAPLLEDDGVTLAGAGRTTADAVSVGRGS